MAKKKKLKPKTVKKAVKKKRLAKKTKAKAKSEKDIHKWLVNYYKKLASKKLLSPAGSQRLKELEKESD